MPRYRRVSHGRYPLMEVSVKAKSLDGKKQYALQASNFKRDDFKEQIPANRWERVNINRHCYLIFAVSKVQSGFTEFGELVCMICFDDGRKLRLKYSDLTKRDMIKINKTIFYKFAPDGMKERVNHKKSNRLRARKQARSTKRKRKEQIEGLP